MTTPSLPASAALAHIQDIQVLVWEPILDVAAATKPETFRSGAYIVASFEQAPASVDLGCPEILYIGETHGRTQSLANRVASFARSVGILTGPGFYHCAGERLAELDPPVAPRSLFVAIVPFMMKERHPPDARGMMPQLIEKTLLTAYLNLHGGLPPLNQDGRYMPRGWNPALTPADLATYLRDGVTVDNHAAAETWLRTVLRSAYKIKTIEWTKAYKPWKGLECTMTAGWHAYIGAAPGAPALDFTVWSSQGVWFEAELATVEDSKFAAWDFYKRWNYDV